MTRGLTFGWFAVSPTAEEIKEHSPDNGSGHGFNGRVEKYARSFFSLPGRALAVAVETTRRHGAAAKKHSLGTEYIGQHKEDITVRDSWVSVDSRA